MTRWIKILLGVSLGLLILSYPACQLGEQKVETEMAKYPPEFVSAHQFDLIFIKWVLPGISMFFSGLFLAFISIVSWIVQRISRK